MLAPGTKFGPYELVALLGSGGMGEVYQAWDVRLDRAVAIKVLPRDVWADPRRLEQFACEARIAGGLNHPNVLSIHDVGGLDGTPYLVSELLEGETLRQRLHRGALSPRNAVDVALQVAAGLAAVHSSGIVHRDLKPENIFITREGFVKILDFGLARSVIERDEHGDTALTLSEDLHTAEPTVSGTLAYLSPEQVSGLSPDHRSDLFALGAILWEMLTGTRAFARGSRARTIAAVVEDDPLAGLDGEDSERMTLALQRVLRHSLEKDPEARFQSARDLAFALENLVWSRGLAPREVVAKSDRGAWRLVSWWGLAVPVAVSALAVSFWPDRIAPDHFEPSPVIRAVLPLKPLYDGEGLAISRDGTQVAYAAVSSHSRLVHVLSLADMTVHAIPGTEGAREPFFSYDGQWIGFFADGHLKKVAISGGAPQVLCDAAGRLGATWGLDDTILFTPSIGAGIWGVSADGGTPWPITVPDRGEHEKSHRFPEWLPGQNAILFYTHFTDMTSLDDARIEVLSLETGERRTLVERGHRAQYIPTGYLVYQHADSLLATPFDADRLEVTGPPVEVLVGIRPSSWAFRQFAYSPRGVLVYAPGTEESTKRTLMWVDRHGRAEPVSDFRAEFGRPSLSPDGRQIVVQITGANDQVWLYDFSGDLWTRLTSTWDSVAPVWSPDGKRIAVGSSRAGGTMNLFWIFPYAGYRAEQIMLDDRSQVPSSWSPDGRYLAYRGSSPDTSQSIWALDMATRRAVPLTETPFDERDARFSPDGRWIVYSSSESGRSEVYVRAFSGSKRTWQISNGGGEFPAWSRDGRELFYRTLSDSPHPDVLMAVAVNGVEELQFALPTPQFKAARFSQYDVSPGGDRFLMVYHPPEAPGHLHVVSNWFEDLRHTIARVQNRRLSRAGRAGSSY